MEQQPRARARVVRHPNKVYKYTVEARGGTGAAIVKTGKSKLGAHLGAKWCSATRHREAVASARKRAEERRHDQERVRKEREHQAAEDERFVNNCRAIGGIPAVIKGPDGSSYIVCHSTTGGVIPVPVNGLGEPVDVLVALSRGLGVGLSALIPEDDEEDQTR